MPTVKEPLTLRQLELICMVANGMRYEQVARDQHISARSVSETVNAARQKSGAKNVVQLAMWCREDGFIAFSDGKFVVAVRLDR